MGEDSSLLLTAGVVFAMAVTSFFAIYVYPQIKATKKNSGTATPFCNQDYQGDGTLMETLQLTALVVFSHFICYYLWWTAEFNQGCLGNPFPLSQQVIQQATPNATSITIYASLIVFTLTCAATLPGVTILGYKIPSEGNRRLIYHCNGLASWYVSILVAIILHHINLFDWKTIYQQSGALLSTAIVFADGLALFLYVECLRTGKCVFRCSTLAHDFVMGGYLNPRLGSIDLKLWAEIRVSWMLLYALDISAALCLRDELGYVPYRMWIVLLIHGLYTNACMKGEESIPFTWDIFHERWGWMLVYWNLAGVAFAYSFNGRFIATQGDQLDDISFPIFCLMTGAVIAAYWVFDEANAQKNRFRAQLMDGGYVQRMFSFPQLPNATLSNPKFLETKVGSKLLIDGWWKYVRKPHYTADLCLAILLSLTGGTDHFLPFFFVLFFGPMLVHRAYRDSARCSQKYGADWEQYTKKVPYTFIPGIY